MLFDQIAQEIAELREEAAEARALAATFKSGPTVEDLLKYASVLEREAAQLEEGAPNHLGRVQPPLSEMGQSAGASHSSLSS